MKLMNMLLTLSLIFSGCPVSISHVTPASEMQVYAQCIILPWWHCKPTHKR